MFRGLSPTSSLGSFNSYFHTLENPNLDTNMTVFEATFSFLTTMQLKVDTEGTGSRLRGDWEYTLSETLRRGMGDNGRDSFLLSAMS